MFLSPIMLAFVGAAVIPLVLHLLSRSRQTELRWGAMMFLDEASPRRSRVRSIRRYVVLALRCLAIVALAAAMARPVSGTGGALRPPGRAAVAVIVDTSGSTGAPTGPGAVRLDAIRESASGALARLDEGDVAALVTGDPALPPVFTPDRAALLARLAVVQPRGVGLDLSAALGRAADLLAAQSTSSRTIVVVTDRQASTYVGIDAEFARRFTLRLGQAGVTRLLFLPSGDTDRDNVSVREIEVLNPPVLRGQPARVRVTLRNDGTTPRPRFAVTVRCPGQPDTVVPVDLAPDSEGSAVFPMTFAEAGRAVVSAEIAPTGPAFDDRLSRVLDVVEATRVLVVGTAGPASLALSPLSAAGRPGDTISATVAPGGPRGPLPRFDLDRNAVVLIPHLQSLGEEDLRVLRQFVFGGGGLVVGVRPLTSDEALSRLAEMLPASVGRAAEAGGAPMRVELTNSSHAIAGSVANAADVFPGASVVRYRALSGAAAGSVVLRLPPLTPLLVEGRFGRGTVLLGATPLEGPWNDLARSVGYVPMLQAAVRYAAGPSPDAVNLKVGDVLSVALPPGAEPSSAALVSPAGLALQLRLEQTPGGPRLVHGPLAQAGLYELRYRLQVQDPVRAGVVEPAYVRPPPGESDLRADDELIGRTAKLLGAEILPTGSPLSANALRHGSELWGIFIVLAVGFLVAEVVLARYWRP